jgi:hypothetical protein
MWDAMAARAAPVRPARTGALDAWRKYFIEAFKKYESRTFDGGEPDLTACVAWADAMLEAETKRWSEL